MGINNDESILIATKALGNQIKRVIIECGDHNLPQLTGTQYAITRYINENKAETKQKDLEKYFNIRRSTATVILQTMEKNDLILRKTSQEDARIKIIELTSLGQKIAQQAIDIFEAMENKLIENISQEEQAFFLKIVNQMIINLESDGDVNDKRTC